MKNLHLIPTDKPSRLVLDDTTQNLILINKGEALWGNQHIYITSDEKIKERDYFVSKEGTIHDEFGWNFGDKKIILTTDQNLIDNGVQAIDDNFLEWFVKNPSCEEVEVEKDKFFESVKYNFYKIILPEEKAKQRAANYMALKGALDVKEETLEEAAERMAKEHCSIRVNPNTTEFQIQQFIIKGAKWQAERTYSEQEVLAFEKFCIEKIADFLDGKGGQTDGREYSMEDLFEQFKKK
jgi:hypothetical protein